MDIIVSSVQEFLIKNIPKVVVKFSRDAKRQETLESRRAADIYISARMNTDSWVTYSSFNEEILIKAASLIPTSFTDQELKIYSKDKNRIPYKYRDYVVTAAREWYIRNYDEKNEYYRMLAGKPPLGAEYIYLDDDVYVKYEIPKVPVHDIPHIVAIMMDEDGVFSGLHDKYPQYDYLNYLGLRRIDILTARNADNFDILYMPKRVENYSFNRDFFRCYDQCKEYMLTVVYNVYYSSKYDYYDNYLAFLVLMMAVQELISNVFKILVNRDFYDTKTIRMFMESYGIPYSGSFTINQNRLLVKNLNILLSKKSSSTVLIDIMDLLGFSDYELIKYYLVKHHKVDYAGNPVFKYLKDSDGNYILDENGKKIFDVEDMYEFYFNGIPIDSEDVQSELNASNNILSYEEMIVTDPLWVDDATTKKLLMETEFNYLQTKYIDVNAVFRLQDILFETIYLTRLILDKKESETKNIMVTLNLVSDGAISLFDCFILLICLMCKTYGMEPDIMNTPSKILHILGFNFKADFETIRQDILNNRLPKKNPNGDDIIIPNLYRSDLVNYITNTRLDTIEGVNNMYTKIRDLEDILVYGMQNASTIEAYEAYKTLYRTLMFTELNNTIYNLDDGSTPEKFSDYLKESNLDLYNLYRIADKDEASEYIEYITQRLMTVLNSIQYLDAMQLLSITDIDSLIKLLRFFQSYTVDVRSSKIFLLLDSKFDNMVRLIERVKEITSKIRINEEIDAEALQYKILELIRMYGIANVEVMLQQLIVYLRPFDVREFQDNILYILTENKINENIRKAEYLMAASKILFDLTEMDVFDRIVKSYVEIIHKSIATNTEKYDFSQSNLLKSIRSFIEKMSVDNSIEFDIDYIKYREGIQDIIMTFVLTDYLQLRYSDDMSIESEFIERCIGKLDQVMMVDESLKLVDTDRRKFVENLTFIWHE